MNSHQRRKDRKLWQHEVRVAYPNDISHWAHYEQMWEWCVEQWGKDIDKCGWRDKHETRHVWQFTCPKKAAFFALRWSS